MAFRTQKISQMTPKGSDLEATDLIEVSTIESGSYVTRSITGQELIDAIPAPSVDWGDIGGTLSDQTDLNTALSGKVPTSRTLTINGTTQDLSADRTFTISTGITIGTTAITSGTVGRVLFEGTGNVVQQSSSLFWDSTNNRLGIGTSSPAFGLDVVGTARVSGILSTPAGLDLAGWYLYASGTSNATLFGGSSWVFDTVGGGGYRFRTAGNTDRLRIESTGNVLINTTTDAGFRLDVNGTARVQSNGTFGITNTRILTIRPEDTTGAYGNSCSIRGGVSNGRLDFYSATNITELRDNIILLTSATGPSVQVGTGSINLNVGGTRLQVAPTTGNVLIGTTTDAGFRLDVNGTARFVDTTTFSSNIRCSAINALVNQNIEIQATWADSVYVRIRTITNKPQVLIVEPAANLTLTSGTHDTQRILHTFAPTSGTAVINALTLNQTINQTGGANGITRGLYIAPTLTSASDFRAIETTNGKVIFGNLPTSSAGLPTGAIWNDAGTLKIV